MNVVITGAAGFIGSHIAERFLASGWNVLGLDNFDPYYNLGLKHANVARIISRGAHFIECDILSPNYPNDFLNANVIIHAAGQPGISEKDATSYWRNNVFATQELMRQATRCRNLKLIIFLSTSSVYGDTLIANETNAPAPRSIYGVTKLSAEQLLLSAARIGSLPVTVVRLFSVYGPHERPDKLIPRLIQSCAMGTPLIIFKGSLQHIRRFTFVVDVADGLIALLQATQNLNGMIINLASEEAITVETVIDLIQTSVGKPANLRFGLPRHEDFRELRPSTSLFKELTGSVPATRFEDGVVTTVNWFVRSYYLANDVIAKI